MPFASFAFPGPPTPPREVDRTVEAAVDYLEDSFRTIRLRTDKNHCNVRVDTPPNRSPPSSDIPSTDNSWRKRKRVEFYKDTEASSRTTPSAPKLKLLPPSRSCRSSKSILKSVERRHPLGLSDPNTTKSAGVSTNKFDTFAEMLESVVQQLASEDGDLRLDAYIVLMGTLKDHDEIPDLKNFKEKMTIFMHFLRRDMDCSTSSKQFDTNITSQALKVLLMILRVPQLTASLNDDFRSFVIDRSIIALQNHNTPKVLVTHYLYVLAQQSFTNKVLTPERASKIIKVLGRIDSHVKGNSVLVSRLLIYQRLLDRTQAVMIVKMKDWIGNAFQGMLSSIRDIRIRAIELNTAAGILLGSHGQCSKTVMDYLAADFENEGAYGEFLSRRLLDMMQSEIDTQYVPQIWAIPVLYLRGGHVKLKDWPLLKVWLSIIQSCLNTGTPRTRFQALVSWNRLVFVVNPSASTQKAFINLLRQPIFVRLERTNIDKPGNQVNQMALSSYYNLLYYALRPDSSFDQLDLYWEEYVSKVLQSVVPKGMKDSDVPCRVLLALLGTSNRDSWDPNRANEANIMKPEELPRLDPKWIRLRIRGILNLYGVLIRHTSLEVEKADEGLPGKVWTALLRAISEAGAQEIKASPQFKEAVAHVLNFLRHVFMSSQSLAAGNDWLSNFAFFVQVAVNTLGPMHFVDKIVMPNDSQDFAAAPTLPNRPSAASASQAPALIILDWFLKPPSATTSDTSTAISLAVQRFLISCLESRSTVSLKLELLREFAQRVSSVGSKRNRDSLGSMVWIAIVQLARATFQQRDHTDIDSSNHLRNQVSYVVQIISTGNAFDGSDHRKIIAALVHDVAAKVAKDESELAVVQTIIEPLAETLCSPKESANSNFRTWFASLLLGQNRHPVEGRPIDSRRLDRARASPQSGSKSIDPYHQLYEMTVSVSNQSYDRLEIDSLIDIELFLHSLQKFLQGTPLNLRGLILQKLQGTVATWVADSEQKLAYGLEVHRRIRTTILDLHSSALSTLLSLPRKDSSLLESLEIMLSSGLRSRRRAIVNATIEAWNSSFGLEETLQYPESVARGLRSLRQIADLLLPTFPDGEADRPPSFVDSEDDTPLPLLSPAHNAISKTAQGLPHAIFETSSSTRRLVSEPRIRNVMQRTTSFEKAKSSPVKQAPKRILKRSLPHEESQIQFEAIESSPSNEAQMDSQVLTDHQKEVRSRQKIVSAGMYPDLQSDTSRDERIATFMKALSRSGSRHLKSMDTTPKSSATSLPVRRSGTNDAFMSSSPTPQRNGIAADDHRLDLSAPESLVAQTIAETDPPSSPPQLPAQEYEIPVSNVTISPTAPVSKDFWNQVGKIHADGDEMETFLNFDACASSEASPSGGKSSLSSCQTTSKVHQADEDDVSTALRHEEEHDLLPERESVLASVDVQSMSEPVASTNDLIDALPERFISQDDQEFTHTEVSQSKHELLTETSEKSSPKLAQDLSSDPDSHQTPKSCSIEPQFEEVTPIELGHQTNSGQSSPNIAARDECAVHSNEEHVPRVVNGEVDLGEPQLPAAEEHPSEQSQSPGPKNSPSSAIEAVTSLNRPAKLIKAEIALPMPLTPTSLHQIHTSPHDAQRSGSTALKRRKSKSSKIASDQTSTEVQPGTFSQQTDSPQTHLSTQDNVISNAAVDSTESSPAPLKIDRRVLRQKRKVSPAEEKDSLSKRQKTLPLPKKRGRPVSSTKLERESAPEVVKGRRKSAADVFTPPAVPMTRKRKRDAFLMSTTPIREESGELFTPTSELSARSRRAERRASTQNQGSTEPAQKRVRSRNLHQHFSRGGHAESGKGPRQVARRRGRPQSQVGIPTSSPKADTESEESGFSKTSPKGDEGGHRRSSDQTEGEGEDADESANRAGSRLFAPDLRPKATPKSIFARLRQMALDFRGLVLGPKDHRAMDDALFEVRVQMHEAAQRGAAD